MSVDLLLALQDSHAFDPSPIRGDLGIYHVPFHDLTGAGRIEQALGDGCRRVERIGVVGDSGTGKSSLTASVLGPLADGVAPILVPVHVEPHDTVAEPRAMFAHIAAVIARVASDAAALSERDREAALAQLTAHRPVRQTGGRSLRLIGGWMGATLGAELTRQAGPLQHLDRSATETFEILEQMVSTLWAEGLVPVLVFDDTDRWLSGTNRDQGEVAAAFFDRVLPALGELRCSVVVAIHRRYLANDDLRAGIRRAIETLIEVPTLSDASGIGAILESRVRAHRPDDAVTLDAVMTGDAIERLFDLYTTGLRGELRGVVRTAHVALAEACDGGFDRITASLIESAAAAWEIDLT